ncbi:MAG: FtsQ-type POTRA domain-containing protein [Deltaproteobacteria bacterium]|nr:FtsQ-type POTRA domain-containing protein [Deltaproteobacteria bacterium]
MASSPREKKKSAALFRSQANRRNTDPSWFKGFLRVAFKFLFCFFIVVGAYGLYDWGSRWFLSLEYFKLKSVTIEPSAHVSQEAVEKDLQPYLGKSIFTISLKELCKRWESNPWVEEVMVRRHLPSRLSVRFLEYRPVALLRDKEIYHYIDGHGSVFKKVGKGELMDFPIFTGVTQKAILHQDEESLLLLHRGLELLILSQERSFPSIKEISEIQLEKGFGLTLYPMKTRVAIRFGWGQYEEKWRRLERIWRYLEKGGRKVKYIDLDYGKIAAVGFFRDARR